MCLARYCPFPAFGPGEPPILANPLETTGMELGQAAAERGVVGGDDTHKLEVETLLMPLDGCWRLSMRSCFRANWDTRTDRRDSQHLSSPMAVDIVLESVAVPR
jgi:hypothetical protein